VHDAFGREVEGRHPHVGLAAVVACATLVVAIGIPIALELAGHHTEAVVLPAVIVSGAGGALTRRLLAAEPLAIAVPTAHPRAVGAAAGAATAVAIALGFLLAGGTLRASAWLGIAGLAIARPLVAALFYEPTPEPADEPFQIDPGEIERSKYEAMRTSLPRGF
jgi:hypothetical protein